MSESMPEVRDGTNGSSPLCCRICGSADCTEEYVVSEMMFGWGDTFNYFRCSSCGCLQIADIPTNIDRYYPPEYYSFDSGPDRHSRIRRPIVRIRNRYAIGGHSWIGKQIARFYPYPFGEIHHWLKSAGLSRSSRILDVGCGSGELLFDLAQLGYTDLLGIDPHIPRDIHYDGGLRIARASLSQVDGKFDLIMFHHALEHVPDQVETITATARRLKPGGHCLIRVPVVSSYAWSRYREKWVQLDAPRHFFLHSLRSLELLGREAGLELVEVRHDSNELQFIGSNLYRRGIPLTAGNVLFSRRQRWRFRRLARRLNESGRGDQAAFLFVKI